MVVGVWVKNRKRESTRRRISCTVALARASSPRQARKCRCDLLKIIIIIMCPRLVATRQPFCSIKRIVTSLYLYLNFSRCALPLRNAEILYFRSFIDSLNDIGITFTRAIPYYVFLAKIYSIKNIFLNIRK